jgi:hypothetical protein
MEGVKMTSRLKHQRNELENELYDQTAILTKVEMFDNFFTSCQEKISSKEIFNLVNSIFLFDLSIVPALIHSDYDGQKSNTTPKETTQVPLAKVLIDSYLEKRTNDLTGEDIRKMINQFFGVNLAAISALAGARISLFSKGQWILQHENDLFAVHTGIGDVDVRVFPTNFFIEQSGVIGVTEEFKSSLQKLGFSYQEEIGTFSFTNPTGKAVPDSFKGQTLATIIENIQKSYKNL